MFNDIVLSFSFHCRSTARLLRSLLIQVVLLPALLYIFMTPSYAAPASESKLPPSGRVVVSGSVPLANLISLWADDLTYRNPRVSITVADAGTTVGVEALLNGSADSVLTDMPLSRQDEGRFMDRFGYAPTLFPVAMDGVAVYVSSFNPLRKISITQLDAIYSANLSCGAEQPLSNWGQLGIKGELGKDPITALGLTVSSGAYLLFKEVALCSGDFSANFQALAGPGAVEATLNANPAAIGFYSSARHPVGIRALEVAPQAGKTAVFPSIQSIQSGHYPLARRLSIILNIPPDRNVDPAVQAFLDYALSAAGQAVATKAGYVPLPVH
jgi:phosphate transport system substrate-binding protein